jgi:dipeptide/tripeptide permease
MRSTLSNRGDSERLNKYSGLRRVREDVPWRLWIVAGIGFWERAAFWGLTAPWRMLLLQPLHNMSTTDQMVRRELHGTSAAS